MDKFSESVIEIKKMNSQIISNLYYLGKRSPNATELENLSKKIEILIKNQILIFKQFEQMCKLFETMNENLINMEDHQHGKYKFY
jgi:hypothetical protein